MNQPLNQQRKTVVLQHSLWNVQILLNIRKLVDIVQQCARALSFLKVRPAICRIQPMKSNCEDIMIYYQDNGEWPGLNPTCECFEYIPEEAASVILNCRVGKYVMVDVWSLCSDEGFSLFQRTITTDPHETCPVSCGLCEAPPVYDPTT